jgi:tetratricopeptide (TPR) repeat protein
VALETLEGYFRSHPLPSERIEQINKMIAEEHWGNLTSERPLQVAYAFWTERANQAYDARRYQEAVGLAKRSLGAHPDQPQAWEVLGWSEFALANFSEAAAAYRKLLDSAPSNEDYLHAYADSLAGNPSRAVREFQTWLADHTEVSSLAVRKVELAGLLLVAHDKVRAEATIAELRFFFHPPFSAEFEGRMGWWNYRAGNYSAALNYLTQAARQRPGDVMLSTQLGWVFIEQRDFEDALNRFGTPKGYVPLAARRQSPASRLTPEARMGSAVAYWLAQQTDEALKEFSVAVDAQPEWLNPKWNRALYSPTVVRAVSEMQAEKRKHRSPQRLP